MILQHSAAVMSIGIAHHANDGAQAELQAPLQVFAAAEPCVHRRAHVSLLSPLQLEPHLACRLGNPALARCSQTSHILAGLQHKSWPNNSKSTGTLVPLWSVLAVMVLKCRLHCKSCKVMPLTLQQA